MICTTEYFPSLSMDHHCAPLASSTDPDTPPIPCMLGFLHAAAHHTTLLQQTAAYLARSRLASLCYGASPSTA